MNAFVVSGLVKRRAELAGDIENGAEASRCAKMLARPRKPSTPRSCNSSPTSRSRRSGPKAFRPPADWSNRGADDPHLSSASFAKPQNRSPVAISRSSS